MCGRFTLGVPFRVLVELYDAIGADEWSARYNIAPTQLAPVVRASVDGGRTVDLLRWGLVPSWAKDPSVGNRMINARSESAAEKPAYRSAMRRRRGLVPADGFFEWQKTAGGRKQPWLFRVPDAPGGVFSFAGLWEIWRESEEAEPIVSFTILTTSANDLVRPVHDRMPVILAPDDAARWLDPAQEDPEPLLPLLAPFAAGRMTASRVSTRVNSPANDDASCIEPLPEQDDSLFA